MVAEALSEVYRPILGRVPDARKARLPLFPALLFPYSALALGSGAAAILALWNALLLRSWWRAAAALLLGLTGVVGFRIIVVLAWNHGAQEVGPVMLMGRVWHLALGAAIGLIQRPLVRGHLFLGGRQVPLVAGVVAGIVLLFALPWRVVLALMGL